MVFYSVGYIVQPRNLRSKANTDFAKTIHCLLSNEVSFWYGTLSLILDTVLKSSHTSSGHSRPPMNALKQLQPSECLLRLSNWEVQWLIWHWQRIMIFPCYHWTFLAGEVLSHCLFDCNNITHYQIHYIRSRYAIWHPFSWCWLLWYNTLQFAW